MPGLAMLNAGINEGYQRVLEHVEVEGLVKLVQAEGYTCMRPLLLPKEKRENSEDKRWWKYMENVGIPRELVRADGKPLRIVAAYQPIFRKMPPVKEETYGELRDRIAKETGQLAKYSMEQTGKLVNAFHLTRLSEEFVMTDSAQQCLAIVGDGIFHNARESFEPRWTFLTSFYEIE